jgi:hypothetical protein
MTVDLVDYKVDPYGEAMHDHPDGGGGTFFHLERHNCRPNIPHNEVCIFFTYIFNFRLFHSFWSTRFFHHVCKFL